MAAGILASPAFADGVSFVTPKDASTQSSPVHLQLTVDGMTVRPAADGVIPGTGHFHVLIDEDQQYEEGDTIPFDDTHKHYGKGQKDVDVDLQPGKHKLTLQFANALHQSYGPKYAASIMVTVN
eukprot:jgi/Chrzof1/13087/Cz07g19100.t1